MTSQQGARRQTKQEKQTREEQKRRLEELLKREGMESEARSRRLTQELEAKSKEALELEGRARAELEAKLLEAERGLTQEQGELREAGLRMQRLIIEERERGIELALRALERENIASRQAELAKKANITMQQAIQIAMSQQNGTIMECRLIGERPAGEKDQVFYILTIVSSDEPDSATTRMLISAVDGRVVKTWKDEK